MGLRILRPKPKNGENNHAGVKSKDCLMMSNLRLRILDLDSTGLRCMKMFGLSFGSSKFTKQLQNVKLIKIEEGER